MTTPHTLPRTKPTPPMPPLGNDTVTFVVMQRNGSPDAMGEVMATPVHTVVEGCRHRAIPATTPTQRERPEDITDVGEQVWQTHCPPVPAALYAATTDRLIINGVVYQIEGATVRWTDADGAPLFVKILSKVQLDNSDATAGVV